MLRLFTDLVNNRQVALMKTLKTAIIFFAIGMLVGLWFGINIGRDEPIYSNPFDAPVIQEKLEETEKTAREKGGEALEQTGKAIKDQIKD
jgi:hypothetical protein